MVVLLTMGLVLECTEPNQALVRPGGTSDMQRDVDPHEEDCSNSVISKSDKVQVCRHACNFSVA